MKTRPTIKHLSSSQVLHGAGEAEAGLEAPREGEALNGTQLPWPIQTDWIGLHSLFLPLFSAGGRWWPLLYGQPGQLCTEGQLWPHLHLASL